MNLRTLAIFILIVAGALMTFLIYDINSTEKSLAHSLIEKPMENAEVHLDGFFKPSENALLVSRDHASHGFFDSLNSYKMNGYFSPIIEDFAQISSMGLANTSGYEYDVLPTEKGFNHREVWIDQWGQTEKWTTWSYDSLNYNWISNKAWIDTVKHDPRVRPWFKGALNNPPNVIHWTDPYVYNTTFEVGMTASIKWNRPNDSLTYIMAFDLTLSDISAFTQKLKVSENGKVFVLSDQNQYVGLPADEKLNSNKQVQHAVLKHPDSLDIPEVSDALNSWLNDNQSETKAFEFVSEGDWWWGKIIEYEISKDQHFKLGVIIPEKDILSKVQQTKRIIIGSFIFVLVLSGFIFYSYGETRKANTLLSEKNDEITKQHDEISYQKLLIEEQHNDILGSIDYAKRLQDAILPQVSEFKALLPKSFIYYLPKDVVAGDFYWMERVGDVLYFAAADCTGHGVPGAMVSFVCSNSLTKALIEELNHDVGKLLDRTRELVIERFGKSSQEIRDGMDISLCALNLKSNELNWAGANNPLWIVRKTSESTEQVESQFPEHSKVDEMEHCIFIEVKADKQPIGKYAKSEPFTSNNIQLKDGDTLYIFSDGFPDQFGGVNGKKYKSKTFKTLLASFNDLEMKDQKKRLARELDEWRGDFEQLDDVCVIGVRI